MQNVNVDNIINHLGNKVKELSIENAVLKAQLDELQQNNQHTDNISSEE